MEKKSANQLLKELAARKAQYFMEQEERFSENHSYVEEEMLHELVLHGTEAQLRKLMEQAGSLKVPLVIKDDPKKNKEYMAVSGVALMTRLAIEHGVPSRNALLLSDFYLDMISRCATEKDIDRMELEMTVEFQRLIQSQQEAFSENHYVEDCKRYIAQNMNQKIRLQDLACDLGLSPNYLSRLFVEKEGMSFSEYLQRARVDMAKNLLKFSGRTISEISSYLSFSSQSYFCNVFKKHTGMTPNTYRNCFRSPEF